MNTVYLVGAGTGEGMLTLRGAELLKLCDCVVYDSLVSAELLSLCPPRCERIFAGKRAGAHSASQEQINALLVECGKKYPVTVRLKGGDPFVFGRGGEEMLALRAAGIACEAVPGVTSAVAAAELCGIPVTHRGAARGFTVLAAQSAEGSPDFSAYGRAEETLVFLMAKAAAADIMRGLLAGGMAEDMPVALISAAGTEHADCRRGCLRELASLSEQLPAPLTAVVGKVCSPALFPPLARGSAAKKKVCVTGTPAHVLRVCSLLHENGIFAEKGAFLRPVPLDFGRFFEKMRQFRWLCFTSENGVRLFFAAAKKAVDMRAFGDKKFAAIGPHTAEVLRGYGFIADLVPREYTARALASALAAAGAERGETALFRAEQGGGPLGEAGEQFSVYTLRAEEELLAAAAASAAAADIVTFGSAFGAKCLLDRCSLKAGATAVCIGQECARALRERGYSPVVCGSARAEELAQAVVSAAKEDL